MSATRSGWMTTALIVEAVLCFGPIALLWLLGLLFIRTSLDALSLEPLYIEDAYMLFGVLIAGGVGLIAMFVVVRALITGRPVSRPVPVLAAAALGAGAILSLSSSEMLAWSITLFLPVLATVHFLFLARRLLVPKGVGVIDFALLLPMAIIGGALIFKPEFYVVSQEELRSHWDAWRETRPATYSFELQIQRYGNRDLDYPRRIEVRGTQVTAASYTFVRHSGDETVYPAPELAAWTMDKVFQELLAAQESGARVRAIFNERGRYIEHAAVKSAPPREEWSLKVLDFQPGG